jgi:imidazolonepropionase-like amidohydrolase/ABC-type molybdate transport system substrate-binding protein
MRWMKPILLAASVFVGAFIPGACSAPQTGQSESPVPTLFEGAQLIAGDGSALIQDSAFIVENGRFTQIGTRGQLQTPAGGTRVDLTGKTVMPAIVDAHAHLATERELLLEQLQRAAYYGIAAVISMGVDPGDFPYQMREETKTMPDVARYFTAGRGIVSPNGGPGQSKIPYEVTTEEAARAAVRELAPLKPNLVKIWVDDRAGTVEKLSPALFNAVIDEAHKADLRVASHIFALEDGKALLRSPAKLDVFAHLVRDKDVDDEFMTLIQQRPDILVLPNLPDRGEVDDLTWLSDTFNTEALWRLTNTAATRTPDQIKTAKDFYGVQARNLARLNTAGVRIGFGTDSTSGWTAHTEMADMVTAGMTPAQVIVAATRTAAEIIGVPDLGTVAEGKSADFIVLDANPLDDIRNTRRINAVYLRGTMVDREGMRSRWTGPLANEISVYSPASVQEALRVLGPEYTKDTGTKVTFAFSSGGVTQGRITAGAPADVIALAKDLLEPMAQDGLIKPETLTVIGTVRTGLAVREGAPQPDISTVEKFKQTLLSASSISYQNPATGSTSGAQIAKIIEGLGIANQVRGKLKFVGGAGVARGEAELHMQPISELMPVPGITIVGTLPAELNATSDIAAAVVAKAVSPDKALAFVRYLARPEVASTYRLKGVEPPAQQSGAAGTQ